LKRRFHDRSKRIQRRLERDKFKILLMPLALLALFVSMVALAAAALNHSVHGHGSLEVLLVALGCSFFRLPRYPGALQRRTQRALIARG
jgi:hypothetical protein